MAFNSITRLRLRSALLLPGFAQATRAIAEQMSVAPGFLGGAVLAEGWMVFWTRSAWDNADTMTAFRDSGSHREVMPKLIEWCDETSVTHWEGDQTADWIEIHTRMAATGRASSVRRPSKAHSAKRIAPLWRWAPEQPIAAKSAAR